MSPRLRRQWTEEDVHRLKLLADGNVSADSIAKTVARPVRSAPLSAKPIGSICL
jgi:hypothetical protein